jgi:glutathione synthase/RimK-type ligase-like ATP-grasp enzyme
VRIALLFDPAWLTNPGVERRLAAAGHEPVANPDWSELGTFELGFVRAHYWERGREDLFSKAVVLDALGVPHFHSIAVLLRGDDKAVSGQLFRRAGLRVPPTWVLEPQDELPRRDHGWVVKPRVAAKQEGVEVFDDRAQAQRYLRSCTLAQVVQERILGRYWRVVATADRAVRTYTMPVDERGVTALPDGVPRGVVEHPDPELELFGVRMVQALGARMMGLDILEDEQGQLWALEANAGFGFNPGDDAIEVAMVEEVASLQGVASATPTSPGSA